MVKLLFYIIVKVRGFLSPIIYWVLRKTIFRGRLPNEWETVKELNLSEFEDYINSFKYRSDFLWGFLDSTLQEPDFFFVRNRKSNRDCDDFAQMWYWWAEFRGYETYMIAIANRLKHGHKICIYFDPLVERYKLADYTIRGEFETVEQALERYKKTNWLGITYDNLIWVITKRSPFNKGSFLLSNLQ